MTDSEDEARAVVQALAECDSEAMARLERLSTLVAAENAHQNLISAESLGKIWQRHIADSAQLLKFGPREISSPWLDLGTGAGFPGLIVALLRPDCEVLLVESRARRIAWLKQVCQDLELNNAVVLGQRIELVATRPMRVISARAFAPLDKLLMLSARFSTAATVWLLPKGRSAQQELYSLEGWYHKFHVEPSETDAAAGVIIGHLEGRKGRKPS